ncbi:hypothetical protein Hanom_Chr11g01057691 [Helianthus anomalus]
MWDFGGVTAFPNGAVIRSFDQTLRSDASSDEWICFSAYPFSLGLRYPFPEFMMQFFRITGLSFAQTMPMVWRVLVVLNQIKTFHVPDLCIEDIHITYRLRSHGSNRFLLSSTSNNPLILKVTKNEDEWKRKFFFVRRDSITEGDSLPMKWLTTDPAKMPQVFDFEELYSYSGPVQIKKEPTSKASTTSKPSASSKPTVMPKPSPATKPRASSYRKRKETDSPVMGWH